MTNRPSADTLAQHQALVEGCGYHCFAQRTILELTGPDRTTFLHNFCTAEIKKLASGAGTEAFITNVQGKTVGYLYALNTGESILLEGSAGQATTLLPHLGKYILLSDAELLDHSDQWQTLLVAGERSSDLLSDITKAELPQSLYDNAAITIDDDSVRIARVTLAGPDSYLLIGPSPMLEKLCQKLDAAGAVACSGEAVEILRLETGSPQFGSDVTDANLPQEVCRDKQAISFTKGCYLGQETVARIDALGHVNRYLKLVRFEGDTLPEPGWEHAVEGKSVLKVTSAAYSPLAGGPIALAYLRRGNEKKGTAFETELGRAEVIEPPLR